MTDIELIDQIIHNATQPLYDKIMEHEKTILSLSRIATEYSKSYPKDYQIISEFLNNKRSSLLTRPFFILLDHY